MIVHLFDDEKFVDATIENFEKLAKGQNRFIVFSGNSSLKHPKNLDKIEVFTNKWHRIDIKSITKNCDLLVLHYLTPLKANILNKISSKIPVVWIVWGGDAYTVMPNSNIYEKSTEKAAKMFKVKRFKKSFGYKFFHLFKYGMFPINPANKFFEKIDYISTVLPPEFHIIQPVFNQNSKYVDFKYDSLRKLLDKPDFPRLGKNTLFGNSATLENNHLDAMELIEKDAIKRLIVPLNYGDQEYRKFIVSVGKKKYGTKFEPIINFLDFNCYKIKIYSCNTMVMHHIRQQGLGNILLALFSGLRVFLNKKSITHDYLLGLGFYIFNLDDDLKFLGIELDKLYKLQNRQLVIEHWGRLKIEEGVNNIVKIHQSLNRDKAMVGYNKNEI